MARSGLALSRHASRNQLISEQPGHTLNTLSHQKLLTSVRPFKPSYLESPRSRHVSTCKTSEFLHYLLVDVANIAKHYGGNRSPNAGTVLRP